ncbi:MAG: hypothetical protein ACREDF_07595 [Thermoplasmata archaeon]
MTMVQRARLVHIALREGSFLSLSVVGAILFLNHQILYMAGDGPSVLPWSAYVASTAVIYAFVRGMFFVGEMRVPRAGQDPSVCPECGQPLADGTPLALRPTAGPLPHPSHAARPASVTAHIRLARPIVLPPPPLASVEDVVNPSLEALLQRLMENPSAPALPGPRPIGNPSVDGPTRPAEDR